MKAVIKVKPLENYILQLEFDNREVKFFDMKDYLNHGLYSELKEKRMFETVTLFFDTIKWENGVDICPEVLYENSTTSL